MKCAAILLLLLTGCALHPVGQTYYHTGVKRMAYKPPLLPVSIYNPLSKDPFQRHDTPQGNP